MQIQQETASDEDNQAYAIAESFRMRESGRT